MITIYAIAKTNRITLNNRVDKIVNNRNNERRTYWELLTKRHLLSEQTTNNVDVYHTCHVFKAI